MCVCVCVHLLCVHELNTVQAYVHVCMYVHSFSSAVSPHFPLLLSCVLQLIVRGAGHILPYDQPERALDMVRRFISGKGFWWV